jgi:hypothetical protein
MTMTRDEAKRVLDAARDGAVDVSAKAITLALLASGDLADDPPPRVLHSGREEGWSPGVRYAQAHRAPRGARSPM